VLNFNANVIVIATKLQKRGKPNWEQCDDFQNIQQAVHNQISPDIPVLPLKFSAAFDAIFEQEKSIKQLRQASPLANHHYREVAEQFDAIYHLIDQYHAMKK
jgi:hypothetical protein